MPIARIRWVLRALGVLLPPLALTIGTMVPASDATRAAIIVAFVVSGAFIGAWWAPAPSVASWSALALAEEANHWGVGPGTRFGTAIEIHSGGDFSLAFFVFTIGVGVALPLVGFVVRKTVSRWGGWRTAARAASRTGDEKYLP